MSINTAGKPPTSPGVYTVGLIGCASQKLKLAAPARELYVSQLFKKASACAELTCDRWYVRSAKHGLVHPDEVIEPYDMRLGIENLNVITLAGKQYRYAVYRGRWEYEAPMQGMGIGQQLGWATARFSGDTRQAG